MSARHAPACELEVDQALASWVVGGLLEGLAAYEIYAFVQFDEAAKAGLVGRIPMILGDAPRRCLRAGAGGKQKQEGKKDPHTLF